MKLIKLIPRYFYCAKNKLLKSNQKSWHLYLKWKELLFGDIFSSNFWQLLGKYINWIEIFEHPQFHFE